MPLRNAPMWPRDISARSPRAPDGTILSQRAALLIRAALRFHPLVRQTVPNEPHA